MRSMPTRETRTQASITDALVEDAVEHVDGRVPRDARSTTIGAEYIGRRRCAQAFARLLRAYRGDRGFAMSVPPYSEIYRVVGRTNSMPNFEAAAIILSISLYGISAGAAASWTAPGEPKSFLRFFACGQEGHQPTAVPNRPIQGIPSSTKCDGFFDAHN